MKLPIVTDWTCCQSADCCRELSGIRMSLQEAGLLQARAMGKELKWKPAEPYGFIELVAKPCPFLEGNVCTVYDVRPFKCRQYGCYRAPGEAFDPSGETVIAKCLQDRETRRAYQLNERKAQKWALKRGWSGHEQ